ncbi:MAG: hypothetical protein J3K34DRAFT_483225 [Monoraphidium minutum]|nr:MAG: hypothetical protein J3K34DRAFT_483225 [Monoraphidium minutum]
MAQLLAGLSEAHELQVQQLLRFTRAKRAQHARECGRLVADLTARRVACAGDVLSGAEVQEMLGELRGALEKQVDEEVANAYHSGALVLQLALQQAQAAGASIAVDTSALEDERMLAALRAAEAAAAARPAADFARKLGAVGGRPPAILGGGDAGAAAERDALRSEVEALRGRLQALQVATTAAMRDKSELARRLEAAEAAARDAAARTEGAGCNAAAAAAAAAAADGAAARAALEARLAEAGAQARAALDVAEAARAQLAALQSQLRCKAGEAAALEAAAAEKLQASKQFKQLQALMAQKSQQVVALRQRLANYEPEEVASADEQRERHQQRPQ